MDFNGLTSLQIMIFIIMILGAFLKRIDVITNSGKSVITDLVINVFLPCSIVHSFYIEFSIDILMQGLVILMISLVLQTFCGIFNAIVYRKVPKGRRMVLQYATLCSNAGFLGNPVAEGIYGPLGLLYASIFLIPQRIVMWSAGISYFTESPDRKTVIKKVLVHPCIIAVEVGLLLMISQVTLPEFLDKTISSLGGCSTPMSMLVIGTILADVDLKSMFSKIVGTYSIIRLFFIPAVVLVGCYICRIDPILAGVAVVLAGMPAGSTTAILASKYNGDAEFATQCVVLTTLLSIVTVPIWCVVINLIL